MNGPKIINCDNVLNFALINGHTGKIISTKHLNYDSLDNLISSVKNKLKIGTIITAIVKNVYPTSKILNWLTELGSLKI